MLIHEFFSNFLTSKNFQQFINLHYWYFLNKFVTSPKFSEKCISLNYNYNNEKHTSYRIFHADCISSFAIYCALCYITKYGVLKLSVLNITLFQHNFIKCWNSLVEAIVLWFPYFAQFPDVIVRIHIVSHN